MPKKIDHNKYRNELLEKCFNIFADKGFGNLTVRELATELGVSTGTLYHYWPGKQEIFEDFVLFQGEKDRAAFLSAAPHSEKLEDRISALFAFLRANESYILKQLFIGMDYYRQKGVELVKNPVLQQSNRLYRSGLSNFLKISDPEIITFILSFISGTVVGRMYEGDLVCFEQQKDLLIQSLRELLHRKNRGVPDEK